MKDLTRLKNGEKGVVKEIRGGKGISDKMEAMGIRPGVLIKKVSSQVIKGPVIVKSGNTQVAIGYGMAQRIIIEEKEGDR